MRRQYNYIYLRREYLEKGGLPWTSQLTSDLSVWERGEHIVGSFVQCDLQDEYIHMGTH